MGEQFLHNRALALFQNLINEVTNLVHVFFDEPSHIINDRSCIVIYHKLLLVKLAGFLEMWVYMSIAVIHLCVVVNHLIKKAIIIPFDHSLFIYHPKKRLITYVFWFKKFKAKLIVLEMNLLNWTSFQLLLVFFNFWSHHILVEMLLKLFISIVYAQLLEAILFKNFKSENIKNPYCPYPNLLFCSIC